MLRPARQLFLHFLRMCFISWLSRPSSYYLQVESFITATRFNSLLLATRVRTDVVETLHSMRRSDKAQRTYGLINTCAYLFIISLYSICMLEIVVLLGNSVCTRCVQSVYKVCTRCVQGVYKVCTSSNGFRPVYALLHIALVSLIIITQAIVFKVFYVC
jgi:hypothetical protein